MSLEISKTADHGSTDEIQPSPSNYQMKISLPDKFKGAVIKDIITSVLNDVLQGQSYTATKVSQWTKTIADSINNRVKELNMRRYKHIVQVVIAQQTGAGCRYIARCRWDAECDNQISNYFTNETISCIVSVFGVYLY